MKRFPLAFLVASALLAIPSGASAATTVGQTFVPDTATGCAANYTFVQSASPGGQYAAPSAGVITRWSFQASPTNVPQLKFKVARPAGGNFFTMIGESGVEMPDADTLNSFFTRIPVQAGDIIGWFTNTNGHCARVMAGYTSHSKTGDVGPSTDPVEFFAGLTAGQLDVSALLEPDCDMDGLGDETQDNNLPCGPGGALIEPLTCKGQRLTIVGTDGPDEIVGTPGPDVIAALGGNDKASGLGARDLICGGPGKDRLKGGPGKDRLLGQGGKDTLKGGGSNDACKGGKGKDTLVSC